MQLPWLRSSWVALLLIFGAWLSSPAMALPAYARQTGDPCSACHVGNFGPQLTPHGRAFKIGGYADGSRIIPFSGMSVTSFTHTSKDQSAPLSGHDGVNDNVAQQELSGFVAGKIAPNFGTFIQVTYSEIDRATALDHFDARYVLPLKLAGKDLLLGFDLNNNPTVQDPFNSFGAWSFPYEGSELVPERAGSPFLYGGLEHQVAGLSSYLWFDDSLYAEIGGYRSLSHNLLGKLGVGDEAGKLSGVAPYARLAYQKDFGGQTASIGLIGMHAAVHPDRLPGPTDKYTDVGADLTYQYLGNRKNIVSLNAAYVHERQKLDFAVANGDTAFSRHRLNAFNADVSWYHNGSYGLTAGIFRNSGTTDTSLYAPEEDAGSRTGKPSNGGYIVQADWTPFSREDSPGYPFSNLRLGAQYTLYTKFNGARHDYDGFGRDASDNNTLFLFAWLAF